MTNPLRASLFTLYVGCDRLLSREDFNQEHKERLMKATKNSAAFLINTHEGRDKALILALTSSIEALLDGAPLSAKARLAMQQALTLVYNAWEASL